MSFEDNLKRPSADASPAQPPAAPEATATLPLLGTRPAPRQARLLGLLLAAALLALAGLLAAPLARAGLGGGTLAAIAGSVLLAMLAAAGWVSVQRQQHAGQIAALRASAPPPAPTTEHAADAVNDTAAALHALVGSVQDTATRVAQTTAEVEGASAAQLDASTAQLREIREAARAVLDMALRMNEMAGQAQESAQVAQQSLQAADAGRAAVQNAIGGMDAIRDQIQDTSKRIKRLGESSQEIGEITELIWGLTEQTNVLALNAAIQAASAGEAGRGFSVVAEEVQRLAGRSADATRQIATLVQTIQADTQDAVAAMERSTQGVVAGARLSDTAGTALAEIDAVTRRLAERIEHIAGATTRETERANGVADSIQHIFTATEQAGDGTRAMAEQVRAFAQMAAELRQSVARFTTV